MSILRITWCTESERGLDAFGRATSGDWSQPVFLGVEGKVQ